jgi:3D (Asp-Asp-Asp) domain-containing protein
MRDVLAATAVSWRVPRLLGLMLALGLPAEELRAAGKHAHPPTAALTVTATAYSSTPKQTDRTPFHGAWGDRLDALPDGQRAIAVSRDLVAKGLDRGTLVHIDGEKGTFVVLDRTPAKWLKRIDIYMGTDTQAARHWGRKKVRITWNGMVASLDAPSEEKSIMIDKPQRD